MNRSLLEELSAELGLGGRDVMHIISSAPRRYKVYQINKRSGGTRTIAQPARNLKIIQRYLLGTLLKKLPVHPAATGYVIGKSIGKNAELHSKNSFILKLDFKNFFPSIKVRDWEIFLKKSDLNLTKQDGDLCKQIMFWGEGTSEPKCLSIGAPTSPALSNIIMFNIDKQLATAASQFNVVYSRYADDITVSSIELDAVIQFEKFARSLILKTKSPRLLFNDEKRGIYGKGQRRIVTGLIITPEQKVSIGRERKRTISSMIHKVALGDADSKRIGQLKGFLGFCLAVEPSFVSRMRKKYGNQVIDLILKAEVPRRERTSP